ncbi:hypothetical protein NA56DRAFT_686638 [Hyaloscypha hepaticicola]|uniref:Uncharacterized protein n=1 Tax=Hyaloscypha hepaticicola TaxID=2082293 RepID=A0A2J6QE81_9HELO|nr:hypothetical protein NA56DRAFT_686638 [Hyaloscypha hepaticicola]
MTKESAYRTGRLNNPEIPYFRIPQQGFTFYFNILYILSLLETLVPGQVLVFRPSVFQGLLEELVESAFVSSSNLRSCARTVIVIVEGSASEGLRPLDVYIVTGLALVPISSQGFRELVEAASGGQLVESGLAVTGLITVTCRKALY